MSERIGIADKMPEVKTKNSVPHIQKKTYSSQSMNSPVDRILFLQRAIGNQAVAGLIKSGALQAKLRIGQPGDVYEQEADRVADQVMKMPDISNIRIQRKCPKCEEELRRQPMGNRNDEKLQTLEMEGNINVLKGGGQPLSESLRDFFEPRFGNDFSQVRVYTSEKAAESAGMLNAKAYTVGGRDLVFAAGQFTPETPAGKYLLAHELTHVVQQSGAGRMIQRACGQHDALRQSSFGDGEHPVALRQTSVLWLQRKVVCPPGVSEEDGEGCYEVPDETPTDQGPSPESTPADQIPTSEEPQSTPETPTDQTPEDQIPADQSVEAKTEGSAKATFPLNENKIIGEYHAPVDPAGYIEQLTFSISVGVTAEVEISSMSGEGESGESQETNVTLGYDSGAIAMAIGQKWIDQNGVNILGLDTAFTETKLEGGIKTDKGFEVSLEASGRLACGVELTLEADLIKIEKDWKVKVLSFKGGADIPIFPFDVDIGSNVKLTNVQVHPVLEVEIQPNWERIFGETAKDIGEEAAGEQEAEKAAEIGAEVLGVDAAIIGGFLLGGAAAIGAAILTIKEGDEIAKTPDLCNELAKKLAAGFSIGIVGGSPPGEKEMMPGYTRGFQNFRDTYSKLKQQNPDADDATIRTAIAAQADFVTAQAQPLIMDMAKDTVWNYYASNHRDTWYHSYQFDRLAAWSNIYGDNPQPGNKEYTKYCSDPNHCLGVS